MEDAVLRCDCCGSGEWRELFTENGIRLGQCPQCDLLSIADIPEMESRMTELEEGHYAGTKKVLGAGKQLEAERVLEDQFRAYVELAQQHVPTGSWLDIGCGAGLLLTLAQQAGYSGEGIELNADRRAAAAEVTGLPTHGLPVEDVQFADNSFDVISLINVFSHLTSPAATFTELHRILKRGGVLIMATGEMTAGIQKSHMYNWNLGDHLYFLGDRTMERYGAKVGFDIAHHQRAWFPDLLYSRESLKSKGRSGLRNAVKTTILKTPGAFPVFRSVMLRRDADSAAYASVFALRPTGPSGSTRSGSDSGGQS
jgi:SAM-dependent methyltransferase